MRRTKRTRSTYQLTAAGKAALQNLDAEESPSVSGDVTDELEALRAERDALLKECDELKAETQRLTTIGTALMVGLAHVSPTVYEHMMKEIERSYPMKKSKASTND